MSDYAPELDPSVTWKVDTDLEAIFPIDGRVETVYEITNGDHSETFAYGAGLDNANRIVAAMNALRGIVEFVDMLDNVGPAPFQCDNRKEWNEHRARAMMALAPPLPLY